MSASLRCPLCLAANELRARAGLPPAAPALALLQIERARQAAQFSLTSWTEVAMPNTVEAHIPQPRLNKVIELLGQGLVLRSHCFFDETEPQVK